MLTHITALELWAIYRGIDFYSAMIEGECLNLQEVADLESFLHYRVSDLRALLRVERVNERRFLEQCLTHRAVATSSVVQRQITATNYLTWIGEFGNRLIALNRTGSQKLARVRTRSFS